MRRAGILLSINLDNDNETWTILMAVHRFIQLSRGEMNLLYLTFVVELLSLRILERSRGGGHGGRRIAVIAIVSGDGLGW